MRLMKAQEFTGKIDFKSELLPAGGLHFDSFEKLVYAMRPQDVISCLDQIEQAAAEGYYAVGYVSYEAAPAFDPALKVQPSEQPLLLFGLSRNPSPSGLRAADFSFSHWVPAWSEAQYLQAFGQALSCLEAGESYQVNLTFPLHAQFRGSVEACYQHLRRQQMTDFAGMISGPDQSVISVSPELFFQRSGAYLLTRPMKGTRRRGMDPQEDQKLALELQANGKDRAENVMIVDLLRNDLGRIARTGTVRVNRLFSVERFPTVWQMTSEIEAEIDSSLSLSRIFKALFPCGSVTGAPKVKTMDIIQSLETRPRGVYCGAFGVVMPGGNCIFNVPIRTLLLEHARGRASYSVGSGVVADSEGISEYLECLLKARVIENTPPDFGLFETLLWSSKTGFDDLREHWQRLEASSRYFCIPFDRVAAESLLQRESGNWGSDMRVRLNLHADGNLRVDAARYRRSGASVSLKMADEPVDKDDIFLRHKTTWRGVYDRERDRLGPADDAVLYNQRGEVTETTVANIAFRFGQHWFTPPVHCGLLPGTARAVAIRRGELTERIVTVMEACKADEIHLFNALRGRYPASWVPTEPKAKAGQGVMGSGIASTRG